MANSRKVTLAQKIKFDSTRQDSVDLPMTSIINQIRCKATGTYDGADIKLAVEFPFNILRNLQVATSKGLYPYALPSVDVRIMNFQDKSGNVTMTASGGKFEANFILDRGELLALTQDKLPKPLDHPALPFNGLTLEATWAEDADISTDGSNHITAGTVEIELEQTPTEIAQLQVLYGKGLERYQMPEVFVKGDSEITINTKPTQAIVLDTGKLKKRTIIVTSDASLVRDSTIVSELQLKNEKLGEESTPLDRTFTTIQNEDREQFKLPSILAGVATIDYPEEITNDQYGLQSWNLGDKDLSLFTENPKNGNIRVIEEQKVVNVTAFESGNILGKVFGEFKPTGTK